MGLAAVTWTYIPAGIVEVKRYRNGSALVECHHDEGYRRNDDGGLDRACRLCRGDEQTTKGYTLPVKMIVEMPEQPKREVLQDSLF